jgi:hypothetical protein
MKKGASMLVVFVLLIGTIQAQINVYQVNSTTKPSEKYGIFYTLPRTILKVDVVVKATDNIKGPLSDLAEKYVGVKDAIKFDFTSYEIEDVHVLPVPEPDPDQVYFVEMIAKSGKNADAVSLRFNEAGFLCSTFEAQKDQNVVEIDKQIIFTEERKSDAPELYQFQAFGNIKAKIDTIIRKVTVDTAIIQKYIFRARTTEKTDEELASEILGKIQALRDSKYKLLTGFQEIPYEPATIQYMHQQLEKQENEYLAMFCGKSVTSYLRYSFYYTPGWETENGEISMFRFSKNSGISPVLSNSGEIVKLRIEPNGFSKVTGNFSPIETKHEQPKGFFYRIPEKANVIITLENDELFNKPITVNQLGIVKNLPADQLKVEFIPETGGIKSVHFD